MSGHLSLPHRRLDPLHTMHSPESEEALLSDAILSKNDAVPVIGTVMHEMLIKIRKGGIRITRDGELSFVQGAVS